LPEAFAPFVALIVVAGLFVMFMQQRYTPETTTAAALFLVFGLLMPSSYHAGFTK
jgi:hypothetical protein